MKYKTGADAKKIREHYGLSQRELATLLGTVRESISSIENQTELTILQRVAYYYMDKFGLDHLREFE